VLAGVAALVGLVVLFAAPASAHASLVSSDPSPNAVLATPPSRVVLHFDEQVETTLGAITLSDAKGAVVASGAERIDPATIGLTLPSLADGAFVVVYHVTSADGHPVEGGFTFQVGAGGADTSGLLQDALAGSNSNDVAGVLLAVSRWVSFFAFAALVGSALFLHLWPAGATRWPGRRIVWWGWTFSVVAALATWGLQGPYVTGRPLSDFFDFSLWGDVADTKVGHALATRVVALVLVGLAVPLWLHRAAHRAYAVLVGIVTALLGLTFALAGHARTGRWPVIGVVLDTLHVSAMALWFGGLLILVGVALVLPRRGVEPEVEPDSEIDAGDRAERSVPSAPTTPQPVGAAVAVDDLEPALQRFSSFAFAAVVVLVATGVLQAWRILDGLAALRETTYGSLLIAKVVLVAAIVMVAWIARRALGYGSRRSLRQIIAIELSVGAAVLAVTAALLGTSPAVGAAGEAFTTSLVQGNTIADVTVDPAAVGTSQLHLIVTVPGGALAPAKDADVRLLLPERDLGPLTVALEPAGPNHWISDAVQLPYAGTWTMEVRITTAEGTLALMSTSFEVSG